jgi:NAD+ synthase (glutamine-hydrolysing)
MKVLRIALAQFNFRVGDIEGNLSKIRKGSEIASREKADILVFPELAVTGYPPEDLVFKAEFLQSNLKARDEIAKLSSGLDLLIICGFINKRDDIYNSTGVFYEGKLVDVYNKIYLPNYGVFDEKRYFKSGKHIPVYKYFGVRVGVNICEDIWYPDGPGHYQTVDGNADILINLSASPYHAGKQEYRESMYKSRAGDGAVYLVNCNLVGGQDELVFDGGSTVYDPKGNLIARLKQFEEDFGVIDINIDRVFSERLKDIRRRETINTDTEPKFPLREIEINGIENPRHRFIEKKPAIVKSTERIESIYKALILGTRDYVNKNGFKNTVIAISGGIDSALVAVIAVKALGAERVSGVYMPSKYSADISREDTEKLCKNLGITLHTLEIQDLFEHYCDKLAPAFKGSSFDTTEENLQSRIRGNLIMALSNKFSLLVLTTGNKSEMSVGYATLYGDMAGGFAVIKDVVKSDVYKLAGYINRESEIIPQRIIDRPPSAELRPDQKDSDSLPDYDILDTIIRGYVEEDCSVEEIITKAGDEDIVRKIIRMIDNSEYKRRQAPPGIKVTPRAFGKDRRMPITNGYNK